MFMVCHIEAEPSVCLTRGITDGRLGAAVSLMTGGWCLKITPCPSPAHLATLSSALSLPTSHRQLHFLSTQLEDLPLLSRDYIAYIPIDARTQSLCLAFVQREAPYLIKEKSQGVFKSSPDSAGLYGKRSQIQKCVSYVRQDCFHIRAKCDSLWK